MATASKSFTAVGTGPAFLVKNGNNYNYSVTGTFVGTVVLERTMDGGQTYQSRLTLTAPRSDTHVGEIPGGGSALYRFNCTAYTSGAIVTSLSDIAATGLVDDGNGNLTSAGSVTANSLTSVTSVTAASGSFSGLVQAGSLTGPLNGTTTNDSAAAGKVGQYIESVVSTATNYAGATGVWANLTSISLTAGDWDVTGVVTYKAGATTFTGIIPMAISVNSGTTVTDQIDGSNQVNSSVPAGGGVDRSASIPVYRLSLSATTTVYLKSNQSFTGGTPQFVCRLSARRVR